MKTTTRTRRGGAADLLLSSCLFLLRQRGGGGGGTRRRRSESSLSLVRLSSSSTTSGGGAPCAESRRHAAEDKEQGSTIYAVSTPPGRGGVAVVRLSGPRSWEIGRRLTAASSGFGLPEEERRRRKAKDDETTMKPGVLRRARFVYETEVDLEEGLEVEKDELVDAEGGGGARTNKTQKGKRKKKVVVGVIDEGLIAYFKAPRSFTGEDVCELHLHGSIAVCKKMLEVLATMSDVDEKESRKTSSSFRDVRPAEPGEFSKRAFLNKKMNLVQAESLADLIEAETEAQRALAVSEIEIDDEEEDGRYHRAPAASSLSKKVDEWTNELTKALAVCEAVLDFPGEDPKLETSLIYRDVLPVIRRVKNEIDIALKDAEARELVRNGVRVCIIGATNAGKSTLLNYFAKRDVAIVSKVPGTTRDVVEVSIELEGRKVVIYDTAGHRFLPTKRKSSTSEEMEEWYDEDENEPLFHDEYERRVGKLSEDTKDLVDEIEREGIERGKNVAKTADIIIEMIDATNPKRIDFTNMNIKREDGVKIISVVNKSDTLYFLEDEDEADSDDRDVHSRFDRSLLRLSLRTGQGLEALTKAVSDAVEECTLTSSSSSSSKSPSQSNVGATAAISRSRHRAHARAISTALGACLSELNEETGSDHGDIQTTAESETSARSSNHSRRSHPRVELVAEDLREALRNCSRVVGRLDVTENVLDVLFSEFCIGK